MKKSLIGVFLVLFILSGVSARADTVKVEVAYLPVLGIAPLLVLEAEGWARAEGLDLQLTKFNSGPAITQALGSGKFDAVTMAISPVLVARAAGVDLKVVAVSGVEQQTFIAGSGLAAAVSSAANPAAGFSAFAKASGRPAKIGTLPKGSMPDTALRHYIEKNAIGADAVQIVSQSEEAVRQAAITGAIDGAVIPEPLVTIIKEKLGGSQVIADGKGLFAGHPGFVLALRSTFVDQNRKAAAKLAVFYDRAVAFIKANPDRAADDILQFFGKGLIDKATLVAALTSPYNQQGDGLTQFVDGTEKLQDYQVKIGVQPAPVDLGQLFWSEAKANSAPGVR
ncbi:MAG: ABC transporter substrate-binding protein [Afipia sp.]|nr:ABC transporter substrate-binding protein [Afipia sp.]